VVFSVVNLLNNIVLSMSVNTFRYIIHFVLAFMYFIYATICFVLFVYASNCFILFIYAFKPFPYYVNVSKSFLNFVCAFLIFLRKIIFFGFFIISYVIKNCDIEFTIILVFEEENGFLTTEVYNKIYNCQSSATKRNYR